jgi:hypothetical protein
MLTSFSLVSAAMCRKGSSKMRSSWFAVQGLEDLGTGIAAIVRDEPLQYLALGLL